MKDNTIYALDAYGLIYRSYYAFERRHLVNSDNQNVSAIVGFFKSLSLLLKKHNPQYMVAAFDSRTPTFRHEMYPEYKAKRQKTPQELHDQVPIIEEILRALGMPLIQQNGVEADDIIASIATFAQKNNYPCRILSADKDLTQLITDTTLVLSPAGGIGWTPINARSVIEKWGVPPTLMLDFLSLIGDSSDNIKGVPGIGEKKALALLNEYGSFDAIFANASAITGATGKAIQNGKESGDFSRTLITLRTDLDLISSIEDLSFTNPDYAKAADLLTKAGAPKIATYFLDQASNSPQSNTTEYSQPIEQKQSIQEPIFTEYTQNKGQYHLVTNCDTLSKIIDECLLQKYAAFDCETTGLNPLQAQLIGFSLCTQKGTAYYIPVYSTDLFSSEQFIAKESAFSQLERLFYHNDMTLIMHNGKYDLEVMLMNGLGTKADTQSTSTNIIERFPTCTIYDTMIAAWVLQPDRTSLKLERLAEEKLGLAGIDFQDIVPKKGSFLDVPLETACNYAAEDADFTLQLWQVFKPLIDSEKKLAHIFYNLETPLLPILTHMEIDGIKINTNYLRDYSQELETNIEATTKEIFTQAGHEFNIASTQQLQTVLFTERKLTPTKKTKTGFSTDIHVLEDLAKIDVVAQKVLEYRGLTKLKSTYVDSLVLLADSKERVHTSFIQTGTATGRLSSRDPNLQNIPVRDTAGRKIRLAFQAPPQRCLVSADYSQIELVILAHLSQDEQLCKAFIQNIDVHSATAALIFNVLPEAVTSEQRRTAKVINFGVMYGMSAFRLSGELGINNATANEFIQSYFKTYSGVQNFMDKTIEQTEINGFVETIAGRRRYIPDIISDKKRVKEAAERVAINTPIQGSAADIVKYAMIAVSTALQKHIPSAKLLLQVHDELIVECNEQDVELVSTLLKENMENAIKLSVPLRVSVEHGKAWGEFH